MHDAISCPLCRGVITAHGEIFAHIHEPQPPMNLSAKAVQAEAKRVVWQFRKLSNRVERYRERRARR